MKELYYIPPTDHAFKDMKRTCIERWQSFDNTHGYVDEKLSRIKNIGNVEDNFMYLFSMFDDDNKRAIVNRLYPLTKVELRDRLVSGGNTEEYIESLML